MEELSIERNLKLPNVIHFRPGGETVDTQDLKSCKLKGLCGFKSRSGHRMGNHSKIPYFFDF